MDTYTYGELLKELETKCNNIEKIMQPESLKARIAEIENLEQTKEFWEDSKRAGDLQKEKKRCERQLDKYKTAKNALDDAQELFELSRDDNESLEALFAESDELEHIIKNAEIEVMLSDPLDSNNAIFTITPGAGGTESQDWASMLYRMYLRWAERNGFKVELLDYQEGDEAGIKDASFIIKGENAYGYAKAENGVHRLVRISPFDANAKRHTSFSSVQVSPEIDDDIDINIEEKDLRIDTYRASGAGGQHVNKTESAIRITHIPTKIVVQCQNDRSQHKNKASALKMLKSKLYELERQKRDAETNSGDKSEIGWGHQIRSYVLTPYQQVKDLRSNIAYSNVDAILDGDINAILEGVLIHLNTQGAKH
ncbi:peptide chain release factor 2 [Helicobacter sp.]|uniref:peptide chain release factor 2 n=1 Tax=Helicobacter sp. TaxID=218 RepID=UPI0025C3A189|nr:peptide chain release factor 2 [Helicobacter sp.]MCI5633180.1 peptide chain release factor 2 [Helicobacter sp.]